MNLAKGLRTNISVRRLHLPNRHVASPPGRRQVVIAPRPAFLP
jgi:hypothetical protein